MTTTGQDFRLAIDKDHPQVPSSEGAGREEGGYLKEHGLQLQKITALQGTLTQKLWIL